MRPGRPCRSRPLSATGSAGGERRAPVASLLALALLAAPLPAQDLINPQTDASKLTTGALLAGRMPALTGDCTTSAGAVATTCTKINGADQTIAWPSYTPVVTSVANSPPTTIGTVVGVFQTRGKTTCFLADITITTNGTASTALLISLPATAAAGIYTVGGILPGTRAALTAAVGFDNSSNVSVTTTAGAYPGANGTRIIVGGCYQNT
jgi:hypothetical protein